MTTKAFFQNIRQQLLEEITTAKQQIVVAVAWFTDKRLFNLLVEKSKEGLDVQLMIADDDINKQYGPDFLELRKVGGSLVLVSAPNPETLMHNKFCVIDGSTVITGSYNWSKKAASNHENITITWNNLGLATQFLIEFNALKERYTDITNDVKQPFDFAKIKQRLQMIQSLITLEEYQELRLQLDKLEQYELIPEVERIINLIRDTRYTDAFTVIEKLKVDFSRIVSVDAEKVASLKLKLIYLEIELTSLQGHHDTIEKEINDLRRNVHIRLGDLILQLLDLKIKWNKMREKLGKVFQYEDLKQEYNQFSEELNFYKANPVEPISPEDQKSIKELYKRGVQLCHPDKVSEQYKAIAQEIFIRLKKAFDDNDIAEAKRIVDSLELGIWDLGKEQEDIREVEKLEVLVQELSIKITELRHRIEQLTQEEDHQEHLKFDCINDYLKSKEIHLKAEIIAYQNKIAKHQNEQPTATN